MEKHRASDAIEALNEELQLQADVRAKYKTELNQLSLEYNINESLFGHCMRTSSSYDFKNTDSPTNKAWTLAFEKNFPELEEVSRDLTQHNFAQAMTNFVQSGDMLRDMMIKHQEARLLLKTPKTFVTIHQRAQ